MSRRRVAITGLTEKDIEDVLLEDLPDAYAGSEVDSDDDFSGEINNFDSVFNDQIEQIENNIQVGDEAPSGITANLEEPQRSWKRRDVESNVPEYVLPEGNTEFIQACVTPTSIFIKLIEDIIEPIVYQSNLYAVQLNRVLNLKKEELLTFIGMNFHMGYNTRPSWTDHFNSALDLNNPVICSAMSRDRFAQVLGSLHCNNNSMIPPGCQDKLYKLRPMIDALNKSFVKYYNGTREVSVDESMIKYKGRSTIKQYMPMKPIKRGYKMWCIADQKGYIFKFIIYQGRDEKLEEEFKEYGLGERVVLELTKEIWGTNRMVYFDNFFSSIRLMERLKNESILACGTVRANRKGIPKNMVEEKKMKRGDWDYRFSEMDIGVFKWKDNKVVHLLSNFHGTEKSTVKRTEKDGSKSDIPCPLVVQKYNQFMGGVDTADRLRALYCVDRKSKKWWHRLFWGLLDVAFVNSYVIYCELFEKVTLKEHRRNVAMGLITQKQVNLKRRSLDMDIGSTPSTSKRRKLNYSVPKDVRLGNRGIHWPVFAKNRGRCEYCSIQKIQSKPSTLCSHCKVYLCLNDKKNCFSKYHDV